MPVSLRSIATVAISTLAMSTTSINAKEFFIAAGSTVPGFSNTGECEAHGYGSGGCALFFNDGSGCEGYAIYVGKNAHTQMMNEYNEGEKITVRHLNANRSFGDIICTFN